MAGEDLYSALSGLNYLPTDNNWALGAQAIGAGMPSLYNQYQGPGTNFGIALGGALLQGLLGYQARRQAAEESIAANQLGLKLLQATTPEARLQIASSAPDAMMQSKLLSLNTQLATQQELTKQLVAQEIAKKEGLAQFELGPLGTQLYERELQKARDLANIRRAALSSGASNSSGNKIADAAYGKPFDVTNPETLAGRRDLLIQRGVEMGMTPNQALLYAEKNLAMDTGANKTALKKIEDARLRSAVLENITTTARAGVEGAGMTGGIMQKPRDLASRLYATISSEEQAKQDAQKLLDSVKPEVVKMSRSPGAVTDFEAKMLIGAGPSSDKTPSENARILKNMEVIAGLESEYANFMEAFIQQTGSSIGGEKLWSKYKSEEVFPAGKYNDSRMSIFDFVAENAANTPMMKMMQSVSPAEQKLLDAGFIKGPNGGWIRP